MTRASPSYQVQAIVVRMPSCESADRVAQELARAVFDVCVPLLAEVQAERVCNCADGVRDAGRGMRWQYVFGGGWVLEWRQGERWAGEREEEESTSREGEK